MFRRNLVSVWIGTILFSGMLLLGQSAWPQPCVDLDADGYGSPASESCEYPEWDCDDTNAQVNPGLPEGPFGDPSCSDALDNDCDGKPDIEDSACCECVDNDGDGYGDPACENCIYAQWDCDDAHSSAYPRAPEIQCNQLDDDCNGSEYCPTASGWIIGTVDGSALPQLYGEAQGVSLAVDGPGKIHMSYFYWEGYPLPPEGINHFKYATNASGSWVTETVPSPGDLGEDPSIALDRSDKVHISYSGSNGLMHTTGASGSWVTDTVDSSGRHSSIALDSKDKVHISYAGTSGLMYATNASGSWEIETLDPVDVWHTAIAVDSSDRVHISYSDNTNYLLKYATNSSGAWVITAVDFIPYGDISIALDSLDKVHVSYHGLDWRKLLIYATNSSGSWVARILDIEESSPGIGCREYPSIALDSSDKVHIAYGLGAVDYPHSELRHLTNASGAWVAEPVRWFFEDRYRCVLDTSISIDSFDNIHIGFIDGSGLQYATNSLCFIASAAFGSEFFEKIHILRSFRDKYLVNNSLGRTFVSRYYKYSPPIAHYIAAHGRLRPLVRIILLPLIGFVSLFV